MLTYIWSGQQESNPRFQLGRLTYCRYTMPAWSVGEESNFRLTDISRLFSPLNYLPMAEAAGLEPARRLKGRPQFSKLLPYR